MSSMGICAGPVLGIVSLDLGDAIGVRPFAAESIGRMRLPTESIGNLALTLTNLVVGSAIRVETQAGTLIEFRTADDTSETFTVPAYAVGNAANDLRIKVRKGTSAPFYIPFETLTTAFVGSASIYVSQILDQ